MSVANRSDILMLGPDAAGVALSAAEFDVAEFDRGPRYELIHGVLVVSPAALPEERGPNETLGYWLRSYQEHHPRGAALDETLPEHDIHVGEDRRRADRAIWAGLGRMPRRDDVPTIAVEFVSAGKKNLTRDYEDKRREYEAIGIREYWVFNRFARTLTVFKSGGQKLVIHEPDVYTTNLLPGFELPLAKLFTVADRWSQAAE